MFEKRLVKKAQKGDVPSFEKLIKQHEQKLYKFSLGITEGNEAVASDILQEALLKAFLNIEHFKGDSSFSSWLWRIIKNEFHNYIRKNSRYYTDALSAENHTEENPKTPEQKSFDDERKKNLHMLIDQLDEKYRDIIILADLMELSYDECASYLDMPVGSVRSRLSRAREKLTILVEKNLELFT